MPWDYGIDIFAAGLVMHELFTGKLMIPAGADAKTILDILRASKDQPLGSSASLGGKVTNIPLPTIRGSSNLPSWGKSSESGFHKLDRRKPLITESAVSGENNSTADIGASLFRSLRGRLLECDPTRRTRAKDALVHPYFIVAFR